jgi:hypothetical protein
MNVGADRVVQKHLDRHAEPEAQLNLSDLPDKKTWRQVVVIPSFAEGFDLLLTLHSVEKAGPGTLAVVVVNAPDDAAPSDHEKNAATLQGIFDQAEKVVEISQAPPIHLALGPALDVLVVDRASKPHRLPKKEGVGLARKVGADLALALIAAGRVAKPLIFCTDADAVVPGDFFERIPKDAHGQAAAWLFPFEHRLADSPGLAEAMLRYEIALRLHVVGLAWARSPYGYQAVGSTIVIDPLAYARVRGFPKKKAGEDFYLLNKLAKQGAIVRLAGAPISLAGRTSHRVPFGTGAALNKQMENAELKNPHRAYAPAVYPLLAATLDAVDLLATSGEAMGPDAAMTRALEAAGGSVTPSQRGALLLGLERIVRWEKLLEILAPLKDVSRRRFQVHTLVDAFITMKLVHWFRDEVHPNVDVESGARDLANLLGVSWPPLESLPQTLQVVAGWEESLSARGMGITALHPL